LAFIYNVLARPFEKRVLAVQMIANDIFILLCDIACLILAGSNMTMSYRNSIGMIIFIVNFIAVVWNCAFTTIANVIEIWKQIQELRLSWKKRNSVSPMTDDAYLTPSSIPNKDSSDEKRFLLGPNGYLRTADKGSQTPNTETLQMNASLDYLENVRASNRERTSADLHESSDLSAILKSRDLKIPPQNVTNRQLTKKNTFWAQLNRATEKELMETMAQINSKAAKIPLNEAVSK
jgi:hypothetical protein